MPLFRICILLFHIVSTVTAIPSYTIHCFNQYGSLPTQQSPSSTAACPTSYSLTSCLLKPLTIGLNDESKGSYITHDNKCLAWSTFYGSNGGGIQVLARCCDFSALGSTSQQNIATYTSAISTDFDDAIISVSCLSNQALIGCTGYGNTVGFDGSFSGLLNNYYPGNQTQGTYDTANTCTTQNGYNGVGVYSISTCYDTTSILNGYQLDCVMALGNWSTGSTQSGTPSLAKCPSNEYFMTSCSAYSWWNSCGQNYIETNTCIVTDNRGGSDGNFPIHSVASAICCRMIIPTSNPSSDPTTSPVEPTKIPTNTPTINPTDSTPGPTLSPYPSGNIIGCFDTVPSYCPSGLGCFGSSNCAQCNFPVPYSSNLLHTCSVKNLSSTCHSQHANYCAYTFQPSNVPTIQPTISPETHIPSDSPTPSPTHNKESCGANRYCIYENIYPLESIKTSWNVIIQNVEENGHIYYDIYFISNINQCIYPSISFQYETIDNDQDVEYINITDDNGNLLKQCNGVPSNCGSNTECLNNYKLSIHKIGIGKQYLLSIIVSKEVHAMCPFDHNYAINGVLTLTCNNNHTNIPTINPTYEPTFSPIYTSNPTTNPSNRPTFRPFNPTQSPFHSANGEVTVVSTQNINHNTDETIQPITVWEMGKYLIIIIIVLSSILCCICCFLCCRIHKNKNKNRTGYKIDTCSKNIMGNKIGYNVNNNIGLQMSVMPSFSFKNKNKKDSSVGEYNNNNNKISLDSILVDEDEGTNTNTNNNKDNNTNSGIADDEFIIDDEFEIITRDINDDINRNNVGELPHQTIENDIVLTGSDDENETPGTDENTNEDVITSEGTGDSDEPINNNEYEQTVTFTGNNNDVVKEQEEIKYNDKSSDESMYMNYEQYNDKKLKQQINNNNQMISIYYQKTDDGGD